MKKYLKIHPSDTVAVALIDLQKGETLPVDQQDLILVEDIPAGHKFALKDLAEDEWVIKYGNPIGKALQLIRQGSWVQEKKIRTLLEGTLRYTYQPCDVKLKIPRRNLTFRGYRRSHGEVGIRNEIWVIPTVGCVNGTVRSLAEMLRRELPPGTVDAVVAYPHNYGCSQLGEDHENTRRILRDMILHPNCGGALIVGLGCENNQIDAFRAMLPPFDPTRIRFMETQKVADEYETGLQLLREIHEVVSKEVREEVPVSELKIGLKCGGSDGFSGITANPLLGRFSDFLIAQGGTTVLTEVPEMFGAETLLMNRCTDRKTFDKTVALINDFKDYFIQNNQPVYENPSPGNKAGGISTLEEKSLGCTQKSGSSSVTDVLFYGERIRTKGLNLLSAPGNDLVAATALGASGCHLVLFTTGRGTPFGTFVPTLKIATNTRLFQKKPGWIDFNAGTLVENESLEEAGERLITCILRVASGEPVHNERKDYREIAIFKTGVTL